MAIKDFVNNIFPCNLFSEDITSLFQRWLRAVTLQFDTFISEKDQVKLNFYIKSMDDDTLSEEELLLGLPDGSLLTTEQRRGRIKSFRAPTTGTKLDIKNLVSTSLDIDKSVIDIVARNISMPSLNIEENYTYDIIVLVSLASLTFDEAQLRADIERIQPKHCILGDINIFLDLLTLDEPGEGLDDDDFVLSI